MLEEQSETTSRKVPTWVKVATLGILGTITLGLSTFIFLILVGVHNS